MEILDIGIHPDAIYETASPYSLVTEEDISYSLKSRKRFAHKGTFGHALLIAGSKGKWEPPYYPRRHAYGVEPDY